ncbi:hypothetical protein [Curtobacterium flaccumfaciens]|uniref:hypothetical protein n=1 Tax=Curtobacterium flaccumfaciens TaxID=2035 RepID=UPI003CED1574
MADVARWTSGTWSFRAYLVRSSDQVSPFPQGMPDLARWTSGTWSFRAYLV